MIKLNTKSLLTFLLISSVIGGQTPSYSMRADENDKSRNLYTTLQKHQATGGYRFPILEALIRHEDTNQVLSVSKTNTLTLKAFKNSKKEDAYWLLQIANQNDEEPGKFTIRATRSGAYCSSDGTKLQMFPTNQREFQAQPQTFTFRFALETQSPKQDIYTIQSLIENQLYVTTAPKKGNNPLDVILGEYKGQDNPLFHWVLTRVSIVSQAPASIDGGLLSGLFRPAAPQITGITDEEEGTPVSTSTSSTTSESTSSTTLIDSSSGSSTTPPINIEDSDTSLPSSAVSTGVLFEQFENTSLTLRNKAASRDGNMQFLDGWNTYVYLSPQTSPEFYGGTHWTLQKRENGAYELMSKQQDHLDGSIEGGRTFLSAQGTSWLPLALWDKTFALRLAKAPSDSSYAYLQGDFSNGTTALANDCLNDDTHWEVMASQLTPVLPSQNDGITNDVSDSTSSKTDEATQVTTPKDQMDNTPQSNSILAPDQITDPTSSVSDDSVPPTTPTDPSTVTKETTSEVLDNTPQSQSNPILNPTQPTDPTSSVSDDSVPFTTPADPKTATKDTTNTTNQPTTPTGTNTNTNPPVDKTPTNTPLTITPSTPLSILCEMTKTQPLGKDLYFLFQNVGSNYWLYSDTNPFPLAARTDGGKVVFTQAQRSTATPTQDIQRWTLRETSPDIVEILNLVSGRSLTPLKLTTGSIGTWVYAAPSSTDKSQLWKVTRAQTPGALTFENCIFPGFLAAVQKNDAGQALSSAYVGNKPALAFEWKISFGSQK